MYLSGLHDCLNHYKEYSANVSENACPVIYDSWNCWPAAEPGTVQEQPCPNFAHLGFSPSSIWAILSISLKEAGFWKSHLFSRTIIQDLYKYWRMVETSRHQLDMGQLHSMCQSQGLGGNSPNWKKLMLSALKVKCFQPNFAIFLRISFSTLKVKRFQPNFTIMFIKKSSIW